MKVLLINPPFYRFFGSHYNGMSLGLSYVASQYKLDGDDPVIYNADYGYGLMTQEQLFENDADFDNDKIFQEVEDCIIKQAPGLVGVTVSTPTYGVAKRIEKICYRLGVPSIFGGPHVTLKRGFGKCFAGQLQSEGTLRPDRDCYLQDVDLNQIITGFGCSNDCVFCASKRLRKKITLRPVKDIIAELNEIKLHSDNVYFVDDTFTMVRWRAVDICRQIPGIRWRCDTRLDKLDRELLHIMKCSGCERIKVGIESGSDSILKSVDKGMTVSFIREKVNLIKSAGLPFTVYLMIGFPGETDEDVQMTINLARELEADYYSLSVLTPYPGTRLYDESLKLNGHNHQSKKLLLTDKISGWMLDRFLNINLDYGIGER